MTRAADSRPDDRRWWTLGAVCVATFMTIESRGEERT